jgi:2',5'-phosphodiesterase
MPSKPDSERGKVRVVTYNILADQNAFSGEGREPLLSYVDRSVLERRRRFPLILHEILSYDPDIVCLQEVDEIVFETLLLPSLGAFGYSGVYSCKKNAGTREGCATFWRQGMFQMASNFADPCVYLSDLVERLPTDLEDPYAADEWADTKVIAKLLDDHPDLRRVMLRQLGHVAQMVHLVDEKSGRSHWVVNTHLYFHPTASHVRLIQMYLIARELGSRRKKSGNDSAIILCGDLNSSLCNAVGKLVVERSVPENFRDLKAHLHRFDFARFREDHSDDTALEVEQETGPSDFPSISLPGTFPQLSSALLETPEFTHYIDVFSGCIDHILVSEHLQCISSAPMPSVSDVTADIAMPSKHLPSDHVSLLCDLVWRT